MRVLLVEDEFLIAAALSMHLEKHGIAVMGPVATGERALSVAERERPDLVLMDIQLAGTMDGIHTALRMSETLSVPIIFTTSYSDAETMARVEAVKPLACLFKPIRFEALLPYFEAIASGKPRA